VGRWPLSARLPSLTRASAGTADAPWSRGACDDAALNMRAAESQPPCKKVSDRFVIASGASIAFSRFRRSLFGAETFPSRPNAGTERTGETEKVVLAVFLEILCNDPHQTGSPDEKITKKIHSTHK